MIAFLKGKIAGLEPTQVIIETSNGVGYAINIPLPTFESLKGKQECFLFTHLHIKEDAHTLYGFEQESEKRLFLDLISISGIGPSTALMLLSSMSPIDFKGAVVAENVKMIQSVKGIGGKTAQRVVLELKDKYKKEELQFDTSLATSGLATHNSLRQEALSALITLGFQKNSAEKTIEQILKNSAENLTLEDLIKQALKSS